VRAQLRLSLHWTFLVGAGRSTIENNSFVLTGRVILVKVEADGDLHITLQDATRDKPGIVVAEIQAKPQWCEVRTSPNCIWLDESSVSVSRPIWQEIEANPTGDYHGYRQGVLRQRGTLLQITQTGEPICIGWQHLC
jgi:hypothetical protein